MTPIINLDGLPLIRQPTADNVFEMAASLAPSNLQFVGARES